MFAKKYGIIRNIYSNRCWNNPIILCSKIFNRNLYQYTIPFYCKTPTLNNQKRYYSTELTKTFNQLEEIFPNINIILKKYVGLLEFKELSNPNGFAVLQDQVKKDVEKIMVECTSKSRSRKMVEVFDDLSNTLCKVADMAEFMRLAHPSENYRIAAEEAGTSIINLVESLNTNKEIYDALVNVLKEGDVIPTDEVDRHVSELFIFDFEQSGIHLSEPDRIRVNELTETILKCGHEFINGTQKSKLIATNLVPLFVRRHFNYDLYNVTVRDLQPENELEAVRELAYKVYLHHDVAQEKILKQMLTSRHELATLCGFQTYAHRATKGSLAESPEFIDEFLRKLSVSIQPYVEEEQELMTTIKNELNWTSPAVQPWDLTYLTVASRNQKMDREFVDDVPEYFSVGELMQGLSDIFYSLYGVQLIVEQPMRGELWSKDVIKLSVVDDNIGVLGYIYCDFFKRLDKPQQECHFTIRGGKEMSDKSYQKPVVVIHINVKRSETGPTLLEMPSIENIFHEMGHGIHSMLARTKYQHITGTRCCTDFAEVPSILMEFFLHDPRVMQRVSQHFKLDKKLTYSEAEEIIDSRNLFNATDLSLQTFYSALDQRLHGINDWDTQSTTDVLVEVQENFYFLPYVPETAWQHRFGHLVGYGAKYYSYLISRAVASWIWHDNFQEDPFDGKMGHLLREEVLCHGGGKPPKAMVGDYLGKEVTPNNLVQALVDELELRKKSLENFPIVII